MSDLEKLEQEIRSLQTKLQNSEKLSSLGTLSAGISHEIQNPLNFVLNFSRMSVDMVDDLTDILEETGVETGADSDNKELAETIETLRTYLAKIVEHGNRASDIIKSILLYSRGQSEEFIPTQIQKLLKEYVWLSFHAMRSNLANFNVTIKEDYDASIPEVKIIPQEICRAVINMMNNACYAVWQKQQAADESYSPTINVKTYTEGNDLFISVEDNGVGMSEDVKKSLFEDFFTTKPVGEGTGLGLSITRHIVEEKHHGKIYFDSEENKFTRFTICLPVKV